MLNLLAGAAGGRAEGRSIYFKSKDGPAYRKLFAILREARAVLYATPRSDMPGGKPIAQERRLRRACR